MQSLGSPCPVKFAYGAESCKTVDLPLTSRHGIRGGSCKAHCHFPAIGRYLMSAKENAGTYVTSTRTKSMISIWGHIARDN